MRTNAFTISALTAQESAGHLVSCFVESEPFESSQPHEPGDCAGRYEAGSLSNTLLPPACRLPFPHPSRHLLHAREWLPARPCPVEKCRNVLRKFGVSASIHYLIHLSSTCLPQSLGRRASTLSKVVINSTSPLSCEELCSPLCWGLLLSAQTPSSFPPGKRTALSPLNLATTLQVSYCSPEVAQDLAGTALDPLPASGTSLSASAASLALAGCQDRLCLGLLRDAAAVETYPYLA